VVRIARVLDLASCCDGHLSEAKAAALGGVPLPRVSTATYGARRLRRSASARHHPATALKKTTWGGCGRVRTGGDDRRGRQGRALGRGALRLYLELAVRRVPCRGGGTGKREQRDFLADNLFYPTRFADYVGRRWRAATIKDLAQELPRDWDTGKEVDKQYLRAQLARAGTPGPQAIGSDESSLRTRPTERIVVSDLSRGRAIWGGGEDRSEESLKQFYPGLGATKANRLRLAVRDMGKPFRTATVTQAPQAAIRFDQFPIMRHRGAGLNAGRKAAYRRRGGKDRRYSKGQQSMRLSRRENRSLEGKPALRAWRAAKKRWPTADRLRESCGQLGRSPPEGWARRCCENWRASRKGQRLKPDEQFAERIARPGEGSAAYGKPEPKGARGCVAGLNNKIRVLQRRAYGLRDEEDLRLKILTCLLPAL